MIDEEIKKLRIKGWSEKGIVKMTGRSVEAVRAALRVIDREAEEPAKDWAETKKPRKQAPPRTCPERQKIDTAEARRLKAEGALQTEIARIFGVTPSAVSQAISRDKEAAE